MAGSGIRSFAMLRSQMPRIVLGKPISSGLRIAKLCARVEVRSGLWQSALKLILLSVAIRSPVILFAETPRIATIRGTHLSAEFSKRMNSSSRHFTSRVPLFEASYLFARNFCSIKYIRGG
jgi:hypothetical protein